MFSQYSTKTVLIAMFVAWPATALSQIDPLAPGNPLSEHVYAGGRLLASESAPDVDAIPMSDEVSPSSGSGSAHVFTFLYSDLDGYADLNHVLAMVNATISQYNSCYVMYLRSNGQLYLREDGGGPWLGPVAPGAASTLENSQCRLDAAGSSVSGTGSQLTVQIDLTFLAGFSGSKSSYGFARDDLSQESGWQTLGSWTVP